MNLAIKVKDLETMEYDRCYMGVDPGKDGAFVLVFVKRGRVIDWERFLPPIVGKRVDCAALFDQIIKWKEMYNPTHCVIEDVHANQMGSKGANFEFGRVAGAEEALIAAAKIPYTTVAPKTWQKTMWQGIPLVKRVGKKSTDTKKMSLHAATRLFPNFDFTKSERAEKPHDGIIDALLMADYCKRKM